MSRTGSDQVEISKREDITLLIRNFNFPLPNAISPSHPPTNFPFTTLENPLKGDTISGIFGAHLEEEKNYGFVQCWWVYLFCFQITQNFQVATNRPFLQK